MTIDINIHREFYVNRIEYYIYQHIETCYIIFLFMFLAKREYKLPRIKLLYFEFLS